MSRPEQFFYIMKQELTASILRGLPGIVNNFPWWLLYSLDFLRGALEMGRVVEGDLPALQTFSPDDPSGQRERGEPSPTAQVLRNPFRIPQIEI